MVERVCNSYFGKVNSFPSKIACKMIDYYQKQGGGMNLFNTDCNFEPTCSAYAKQAIQAKGLFSAMPYIFNRLKRCNEPDKIEREHDPFVEVDNV